MEKEERSTEPVYSKDILELADSEKWQCVVRHLNKLFIAHCLGERYEEDICIGCPMWEEKCSVNCRKYNLFLPPQHNFKILEQFTGENTTVSDDLDGCLSAPREVTD